MQPQICLAKPDTNAKQPKFKKFSEKEKYIIISSENNYGLAIIETKFLIKRNISNHLRNYEVYKRLSRGEAVGQLEGSERLIESFINKYSKVLSKVEYTYMKRGLAQDRGKMPCVYTTVKVHNKTKENNTSSIQANSGNIRYSTSNLQQMAGP